jgi:predicted dehydrogenase
MSCHSWADLAARGRDGLAEALTLLVAPSMYAFAAKPLANEKLKRIFMHLKKEFRVGLIGYGFAGKTFHAPLVSSTPGLRITAVASRNAEKVLTDLPEVTVASDPLSVINSDVDVIVIASPSDTHAALADAALRHGKHVVVDKPFTLTVAEARALKALADTKGLLLSVFQNRRWDTDFLSVSNAISQGLLGTVTHFESHFDRFRPIVRDRWRENAGAGSGLWYDLGPHLVDQALCLFGLPDSVQANLAQQRDGAKSDDWAHVVLGYGARRVLLHGAMLVAGFAPRFVVHGLKGSLVKRKPDRQEQQLISGMRPGDAEWGVDPDNLIYADENGHEHSIEPTRGDQGQYYRRIVQGLIDLSQNPVTATQAITVMAIIEAAQQSSAMKRTVELKFSVEENSAWADAMTSILAD